MKYRGLSEGKGYRGREGVGEKGPIYGVSLPAALWEAPGTSQAWSLPSQDLVTGCRPTCPISLFWL